MAHPGNLDEELRFAFGMLFSADGRFGVLPGTAKDGASLELFDLREATPRVTQVALESSPPPTWRTTFALSPSAASVFVVHESGASALRAAVGSAHGDHDDPSLAGARPPPVTWRQARPAPGSSPRTKASAPCTRGPRCASST